MAKQLAQTPPARLRVLLAEDHEMVREGLKALVNAQPDMEVVGEAADGRAAVARAEELQPDVVVMDITMPGLNGLKATERVKQTCPRARVLTLTRHADAGFIQQLFAAGGNFLDPQITGKVIGGYISQQARLGDAPQGELSEREAEVLRLIAWGHSNKEVAARLQISVKTVEAHKANTMKKLGLTSRIDIVRYALLQGWLQDT